MDSIDVHIRRVTSWKDESLKRIETLKKERDEEVDRYNKMIADREDAIVEYEAVLDKLRS